MFDITAMAVKDSGLLPSEDFTNANKLLELNIIDNDLLGSLKDANGLRNRVIHEYNGLDQQIAYDSIQGLLPSIGRFIKKVEEWIKKH